MSVNIEMPKLSDTMTEGTLVKWHKQVGDSVEIGDVLADVETDKATIEIGASYDGVLTQILIQEGEKTAIGAVLAVLDGDSGVAPAPQAAAAQSMTAQATTTDKKVFLGIDFGTTKTMVASYDAFKKSAKPLTIGRGKFEKPTSMYATESGELLFGDDADDVGITDLPNHIRRFKMKLGKPGLAHMGRKSGTAQQLTTEFLANLRNQLESQVLHTSVDRVILTVPAMFGPAQRHDLTTAAQQAGFSQVELLEEPVAAGIAYCDQQSDLSKQLRFIVVDWGGGTFDVAHLERSSSGEIEVQGDFVVGLDDIGGEVFDDHLWGIASSALESAGYGTLDSQSRENWGRYRRDLSRAKESLSSQSSVSMGFTLTDGKPAKVTLNRADFNNIISPMIQKAASFVSQLLVRAQNAGCPPEFILLAGGTSRIPLIGEELERITGVKCRQWSDGREAIALGAAIRANQLWYQPSTKQTQKEKVKANSPPKIDLDSPAKKTKELNSYSAKDVYRDAVTAAQSSLSKEMLTHLKSVQNKCGISNYDAISIEKEILGRTAKEELKSSDKDGILGCGCLIIVAIVVIFFIIKISQ